MPVYRYKVTGIDISKIKKQVPPADASSVSSGSASSNMVWDVTAPTTSKDDIDAYLLSLGWSFVETDPSDTPQEAADGSVTHDDLIGAGTNTHTQVDSHIASTANPHSVTAAQAGAAPSAEGVTNGNSHDHSGGDGAQIDHTTLSNKGTNTHAQIDTHLAATAPHSGHASTDHDATHIRAGSDEIDGDKLDIDWNPTNYTPATTPTEVDNVDHLTAHLYGIDQALASAGGIIADKMFQSDQMESPNSSDWAVNALAPLIPDASNTGLSVRAFDDTTVEGIGFTVRVPTDATNIILGFLSRAATAPGSVKTVGLDLYKRAVPDNTVVPSWGSSTALTDLSIPTNAYYQKDSQTISISTLGLTVGVMYTFELCRDVTDTLSGDWLLHSLTIGWS